MRRGVRFLEGYLLAALGGSLVWTAAAVAYALLGAGSPLDAALSQLSGQLWWIFAGTLLLGVPAHLVLETLGRQGWISYGLAGLVLGAASPAAVFGWAGRGLMPVTGAVGLAAAAIFWRVCVRGNPHPRTGPGDVLDG